MISKVIFIEMEPLNLALSHCHSVCQNNCSLRSFGSCPRAQADISRLTRAQALFTCSSSLSHAIRFTRPPWLFRWTRSNTQLKITQEMIHAGVGFSFDLAVCNVWTLPWDCSLFYLPAILSTVRHQDTTKPALIILDPFISTHLLCLEV